MFTAMRSIFLIILCVLLMNRVAESGQINLQLVPDGTTSILNPIKVSFNGAIYSDSWWISEVAAGKFSPSVDELFMIKAIAKNSSGSLEDILTLWPDDEKNEIRDLFSDKIVFDGNQGFFKRVKDTAFMAKLLYGPYTIFIIQYTGDTIGNIIEDYPTLLSGGNYYLTNNLKNDTIYICMVEKLKKTITIKTLPLRNEQPQS